MFQKLIIVFGRITVKYIAVVSITCWGETPALIIFTGCMILGGGHFHHNYYAGVKASALIIIIHRPCDSRCGIKF